MMAPRSSTAEAWTAFEGRLSAYVRRRVDSASADDVLGDILLRLVQHQGQLETAANPSAWLFRVAASAIADHYRRRSAQQKAMAQLDAADQDKRESAAEEASAELAQCLLPMIRSLPEPYGEALRLTDIEGLAQPVAARRLGLSTSGMKSRVQRGRAKLKQALLRCCAVQIDRQGGVLDYQLRSPGSKSCTP
ncbi:MAG: sigma-70 family RNA polymerase sigma factor [Gammaproteobacteria bacterium]